MHYSAVAPLAACGINNLLDADIALDLVVLISIYVVQELFRKVRSILNKLTPQMFSQLMKQVTDLTIDTEERLKGVIDLVFEKAIDEPSFSVAYGNMCSCLATVRNTLHNFTVAILCVTKPPMQFVVQLQLTSVIKACCNRKLDWSFSCDYNIYVCMYVRLVKSAHGRQAH